jgi:uncharacterized repeat protein (TIGR03803 family)
LTAYPVSPVVFDAAGNLCGMTGGAGDANEGMVFKLAPPAAGLTAWTETTLHSFGRPFADGRFPGGSGVIFDRPGNLYGTTDGGGRPNFGVVFKLTPPNGTTLDWSETVLHRFDGVNGANPWAGVILDANGNLYGTVQALGTGARSSTGAVYKLTPP